MPNQTEFLSAIDDKFQIKIYGKKVTDIEIKASKTSILSRDSASNLVLVKVYGTQMLGGGCTKLSAPFFTLLPDNGSNPDGCGEFGNADDYLMWTLGHKQEFVSLSFDTGNAAEIIKGKIGPHVDVSADFHVHNLSVTGTSVSGKLRAYLHLQQKLSWPLPPINSTVVDGDFPFSVNVNTCVTVATVAGASAQVCFHTNPNRVCGQVSVGIDLPVIGQWKQNFPIACVNV